MALVKGKILCKSLENNSTFGALMATFVILCSLKKYTFARCYF